MTKKKQKLEMNIILSNEIISEKEANLRLAELFDLLYGKHV